MLLTSSVLHPLPNVVHGFGTRHAAMAALFPDYWPHRPIQHERHGVDIVVADRAKQDCGEADGMYTERAGLLLAIATADCVPLLLARKDGQAVGALHVGWRGAYGGIVQRFADLLRARGQQPGDWVAAIGPSAGACCYAVSAELIEQFCERYEMPRAVVASASGNLNLSGIVAWQIGRAGFAGLSVASECTMCHASEAGHTFHSYRRDRATRTPVVDVHWSVIALRSTGAKAR